MKRTATRSMVNGRELVVEDAHYWLEYTIISNLITVEGAQVKTFGLKATLQDTATGEVESEEVRDVSTRYSYIEMIRETLLEAEVTPVSLCAVIEDIL